MSYLNAGIGVASDISSFGSFDHRDPSSYVSRGESMGGLLGTGIGLMATPFLGPGGIMLGRGIGKMIGRNSGMKQAQGIMDYRRNRENIRMSMIEGLANQRRQMSAIDETQSYLDSKVEKGY